MELAASGGRLHSLEIREDVLTAVVRFANRGAMNAGRVKLVRQGWHVVTDGTTATATVKL